MDSITVTPRWTEWDDGVSRLMIGRLQIAEINGLQTGRWWVLLRYSDDRRPVVVTLSESEARALAEAHARKVLGNA